MSKGGLKISTKGLSAELNAFNPKVRRALTAAFEYQATRSEGRMRVGARWTDRTGNARSSLFAQSLQSANTWKLLLSHGMSYGIYLETRNSGRYAIVRPEINLAGNDLMRLINKLLKTL